MQRAHLALALSARLLAWFALPLLCLTAAPASAHTQRPANNHGLWIGPLPACAGTVASVRVEMDMMGQPQAVLTFRPAWRSALRRETRRLRLDGRVLVAPVVREPIAGGKVALSGLAARQAGRMRAASLRPCPRRR